MCSTCAPLKVFHTRPHAPASCPLAASQHCSSCASYGHTCRPIPCPIRIRRAPVAAIPALPIFEMGRIADAALYEESLRAFLGSQAVKHTIDAFASIFKKEEIKKMTKIALLERRIHMWANENGYSGAAFLS
jgi:hypothetical protein